MGANAQTAVPAFTSGQVLTAAQMTEVNTGIPVFATTVTRDAAFGGTGEKVLAQGQYAYIEATSTLQVYTGSAWVAAGGGLVRVGGGTLSGSSTAFTNIFSSTYNSYKLVFSNISLSLPAYATMILGATTTGYLNFQPGVLAAGTYSNNFGGFGTASWAVGYSRSASLGFTLELGNPNLATTSTISGGLFYDSSSGAGATMHGLLTDSTQYTGFTIGTSSGNITGTVNVYGYTLS
jgi:hypothetical protein